MAYYFYLWGSHLQPVDGLLQHDRLVRRPCLRRLRARKDRDGSLRSILESLSSSNCTVVPLNSLTAWLMALIDVHAGDALTHMTKVNVRGFRGSEASLQHLRQSSRYHTDHGASRSHVLLDHSTYDILLASVPLLAASLGVRVLFSLPSSRQRLGRDPRD